MTSDVYYIKALQIQSLGILDLQASYQSQIFVGDICEVLLKV